jgi:hypothetical protein
MPRLTLLNRRRITGQFTTSTLSVPGAFPSVRLTLLLDPSEFSDLTFTSILLIEGSFDGGTAWRSLGAAIVTGGAREKTGGTVNPWLRVSGQSGDTALLPTHVRGVLSVSRPVFLGINADVE